VEASFSLFTNLCVFIVAGKQAAKRPTEKYTCWQNFPRSKNTHTKLTDFNFLVIVLFKSTAIMHPVMNAVFSIPSDPITQLRTLQWRLAVVTAWQLLKCPAKVLARKEAVSRQLFFSGAVAACNKDAVTRSWSKAETFIGQACHTT
jgi:hypothetical protein